MKQPFSAAAEANPRMAFKVAIEGTFNVYETARIYGSQMIIWTSSIAACGTSAESREDVVEDMHTIPRTIYDLKTTWRNVRDVVPPEMRSGVCGVPPCLSNRPREGR